MILNLLEWALRVVVASFMLLLLSILLFFVFNWVMDVTHGPQLSFFNVALLAFIASVSVGTWGISFLRARAVTRTP
jgi:hypothetical protein